VATGTARACALAAALWNELLFFEVHEVLEAVWKNAQGAERQALQGVIQIAVAFHHLAHGNRRGARTLLAEGRARLDAVPDATLPALDVARLLAETAPWEAALLRGEDPDGKPPRLEVAG
jgi:predicted metal-dependent hydrolase